MSAAAWSELGYERKFLDSVAALESEDAETWMCDPPASSDGTLIEGWADNVNTAGERVFWMGSMGYTFPRPPFDDWRAAGRRVVAASLHYFFGALARQLRVVPRRALRPCRGAEKTALDRHVPDRPAVGARARGLGVGGQTAEMAGTRSSLRRRSGRPDRGGQRLPHLAGLTTAGRARQRVRRLNSTSSFREGASDPSWLRPRRRLCWTKIRRPLRKPSPRTSVTIGSVNSTPSN